MLNLNHTSLEPFEPLICNLFDSAFGNGFKGLKTAGLNPSDVWQTDAIKMFKAVCLPDFKKAQVSIGLKVLELEENIISLRKKEKESRAKRDIPKANHTKELRHILETRQLVLRRLLDGILWTLVWPEKWVLRRFRIEGGKRRVYINTVKPLLKVIEKENAQNDNMFMIICDLTTVAQLGDLIIVKWNPGKNTVDTLVVELKVGPKNILLSKLLHDSNMENRDNTISKISGDLGPRVATQARRMARQEDRLKNFEQVISTGEGVHPMTGAKFRSISLW